MKAFPRLSLWENFAGCSVKAAQIALPPARDFLTKLLS
jgi:hypothetical protein